MPGPVRRQKQDIAKRKTTPPAKTPGGISTTGVIGPVRRQKQDVKKRKNLRPAITAASNRPPDIGLLLRGSKPGVKRDHFGRPGGLKAAAKANPKAVARGFQQIEDRRNKKPHKKPLP